jgi:two-component system chemotaxis response regulator CheY
VVDDNLLIRTLLREILGGGGHEVIGEAADGDAALAGIAKTRPDLVTLDLVMPKRDGFATLAELRARNRSVAVVVCSAWLTKPRVTRALSLGANGFISKPFDRVTLLSLVEQVLSESDSSAAGAQASPTQPPGSVDYVSEEKADERREFARVPVTLPVLLIDADDVMTRTWTVDVSGSGMLVQGADLRVGTPLRFRLTLKAGVAPIAGGARVTRVTEVGRCALAFEELTATDHERLITFLERCARAGATPPVDATTIPD